MCLWYALTISKWSKRLYDEYEFRQCNVMLQFLRIAWSFEMRDCHGNRSRYFMTTVVAPESMIRERLCISSFWLIQWRGLKSVLRDSTDITPSPRCLRLKRDPHYHKVIRNVWSLVIRAVKCRVVQYPNSTSPGIPAC